MHDSEIFIYSVILYGVAVNHMYMEECISLLDSGLKTNEAMSNSLEFIFWRNNSMLSQKFMFTMGLHAFNVLVIAEYREGIQESGVAFLLQDTANQFRDVVIRLKSTQSS